MSEVAWLFHTHERDFPHTARLLASVRQHGACGTWVPLFSTDQEARAFYTTHSVDPHGVHPVVEPLVGAHRLRASLATRSVINLKKFAALWDLQHDFSTVHVIDTECILLGPGDAEGSAALRREQRSWPAHRHDHPAIRRIQEAVVRLFDVRDRRRLVEDVLTHDWLYSWFEDVPTYDSEDLAAFFAYFGASDDVTVLTDVLVWESFDHLLFQYFCCLHRGWRLVDVGLPSPPPPAAWWEIWTGDHAEHVTAARERLSAWQPSWVRDGRLAPFSKNAFIAYHQDAV